MKIKYLLIYSFLFFLLNSCEKQNMVTPDTQGKGGSMARFTIAKNHLYVVDDRNLKVFDISQNNAPIFIKEIYVGTQIETIFPYNNYLFIGSGNGMYIYNITFPNNPQYISEVVHIISCDPVVVNDTLAFITLRSGGDCRINSNVNRLEIIDIKNLYNPILLKAIDMDTPYGLGLDDTLLFICHGDNGLGIYDISNINNISTVQRIYNIKTYDVIPHQKRILVIGESGFYQYSYENTDSIYLMSHIPISQ